MITSYKKANGLKIYIDGTLHLCIQTSNFGLQSWIDDERQTRMYCIDLYRDGTLPILMEYEDRKMWEEVLKILDDYLTPIK